jgi:hypothetical protein
LPDIAPGNCSYGGHAWVVDSYYLDPKGRTLASVPYALEDTIEKHIKLTQITPSVRYGRKVLREKDDIYLVDSTVTGSDTGTCHSPKYPLLQLFLDTVFSKVEALVGVGGHYTGYVPIIQGSNAGPHQEGDFDASCKAYCHIRGWHWIPQAP